MYTNVLLYINEKPLRETQTLRAGCSKVEPKMYAPPQTPFPGTRDGKNFISWRRSLPAPTDSVWWRSMHAVSSYRGNRPTMWICQSEKWADKWIGEPATSWNCDAFLLFLSTIHEKYKPVISPISVNLCFVFGRCVQIYLLTYKHRQPACYRQDR